MWRRLTPLVCGFLHLACQSQSPELAQESTGSAQPPFTDYGAILLGSAQDGGMPHLGCEHELCLEARLHPDPMHRVVALGVHAPQNQWWLFDATPDLPEQIHEMGSLPKGIFLTHAHIGHYTGLMYLGKESMNTRELPVYCSKKMAGYLRNNGPWSLLVELGNIKLHEFENAVELALTEDLFVTPMTVPHRDEFSDTHGFYVRRQNGKSLLYLPDIDRWEDWESDIRDQVRATDYAFLDATFYSGDELPGRDLSKIPHPFVTTSMDLLQDSVKAGHSQVIFIHMNHSNPLWDTWSSAAKEVRHRGFRTALQNRYFNL